MAIGYIQRVEKFSSSHRLHNSQYSDEENKNLYGKCNNLHGHNYTLEITIKGEISDKNGMIMDIQKLKSIIKEEILDNIDHKNIDLDILYFSSRPSTAENISVWIWKQLVNVIDTPSNKLYKVKLSETDKNIAIYKGE